MIEKQFGTEYGPPLQRGDKTACIVSLQAEIDRLGGVPYGWMKIYETLLFGFYNPRTGQCFPSHKAIATKARCGVRTVQRALKWARENNLIQWAHGIVRDGWRVLRTSNRYAFATFLTMSRIVASIAASNGQRRRGIPTSYKSLADIAAEARSLSFPSAPSSLQRH
jgi:Helix-turn-helix domain